MKTVPYSGRDIRTTGMTCLAICQVPTLCVRKGNVIGPRRGKTCLWVSDKARLQPACSATETSWQIEISLVARIDMIPSNTRITKALIRLRGCAGWYAPLLFANHRRQVFSRRGPTIIKERDHCKVSCADPEPYAVGTMKTFLVISVFQEGRTDLP